MSLLITSYGSITGELSASLTTRRRGCLRRLQSLEVYHSPLYEAAERAQDAAFAELTAGALARPVMLDYLELVRRFHTLVLDGVPRIGPEQRNEARRFMTLIDTLYESRVNLVLSAEAPPDTLYPEDPEAEEFQRTASRLVEMQSKDYITTPYKG